MTTWTVYRSYDVDWQHALLAILRPLIEDEGLTLAEAKLRLSKAAS